MEVTGAQETYLRHLAVGTQHSAEKEISGWGLLPAMSLVGAAGLLLIAIAYRGVWKSAEWNATLRWIGLLVLFAPIATRLISPRATRQERLGLLMVLGLGLYLAKVMYSPLEFKFSDELQHWRNAVETLQGGRLFHENPILFASSMYPGLPSATAALVALTGLEVFDAGVIIIGATRLALVWALYLFFEEVGRSPHVAGIASMLYMTNPHFLFFSSFFTYQSLALPLAALVLFTVARRNRLYDSSSNLLGLNLAIVLYIGAVVVTHHITTYMLTVFLCLTLLPWGLLSQLIHRFADTTIGTRFYHSAVGRLARLGNDAEARDDRIPQPCPRSTALLAVVAGLAWTTYAATSTVGYLAPNIAQTLREFVDVIFGEATLGEAVGSAYLASVELLAIIPSTALILLGLPPGIWHTWRRYRDNPLALALAIGSLGYGVSLLLRLSSHTAGFSARTWPFVYVPVAFVLAVAVAEVWRARGDRWMTRAVFPALSIVVFMGGMMSGWPPHWARLPGPYLVAASERSIEPQGVAAAKWAGEVLGHGNRVATDFTNTYLMGSYGMQDAVYDLPDMFFASELSDWHRDAIQNNEIRYLVVDTRLSSALPVRGYYFSVWEPNADVHTSPIELASLEKFDGLVDVDRIFDSGDIIVYDVGEWLREP